MVDLSREALVELAERVEKAEGADRGLDAEIHHRINDGVGTGYAADAPAYCSSIDAAMSLVPEGWNPVEMLLDAINANCEDDWVKALPRYIVAAALRARSADLT